MFPEFVDLVYQRDVAHKLDVKVRNQPFDLTSG